MRLLATYSCSKSITMQCRKPGTETRLCLPKVKVRVVNSIIMWCHKWERLSVVMKLNNDC